MSSPPDPTSALRKAFVGRPRLTRAVGGSWRGLKRFVEGPRRAELQQWLNETESRLPANEWKMLTQLYDDTTPLPADAATRLSHDHPRLRELRAAYQSLDVPVTTRSVWADDFVEQQIDLRYFRGESPFVWNHREWPRAMVLKYFIFTEYVARMDHRGLVERLGEDGGFGCWTFRYPGYPPVSRDLLDSVNEILFLDRCLNVLEQPGIRVLDVGAGYGRSAHRLCQAADVADYCCVDAIPESTFLCEYYLEQRECTPPARAVPLHELEERIMSESFDLAVNIHSFSECTYAAVSWWIEWLDKLQVPNLLVIPNDRDELLAFEPDGTRRSFAPLLGAAGFELVTDEPVIADEAVRELLGVTDHFLLFRRVT
ncbi:MAG: putative sugar O-methyltransferase [Actinobacteria bacterium]|nr:putative sugar O-methyltransferase [Actinomycetota bacterium]